MSLLEVEHVGTKPSSRRAMGIAVKAELCELILIVYNFQNVSVTFLSIVHRGNRRFRTCTSSLFTTRTLEFLHRDENRNKVSVRTGPERVVEDTKKFFKKLAVLP